MDQLTPIVNEVFDLYRKYGKEDYIGEPVSQIEHMCQAGQLAISEGYQDEVVLAAFFHDIGHLLDFKDPTKRMGDFGVVNHEAIGADYLAQKGFSELITTLVANHVNAKRYLTFKYPDYYQSLSEASKQTLVHQGGSMQVREALEFENQAWFTYSIKLREWDEAAKETNMPLPDLEIFESRCFKHLNSKY